MNTNHILSNKDPRWTESQILTTAIIKFWLADIKKGFIST